ncbi:UDP-N-acetylglucosamine transferase subunit ALG13 homolog [Haliotis rufescens]|uniref:UDP-N-acetylglucosamine transferase subunit ALG13 homolog n=1 Tax=Haliotis rufescens TaxID=6454 RepID=UPI00201F6756|nr:UDP-N-acetylglucosamine transferase subunit ALG13 homolog [Haliotis rufescens]
MSKTVFVTVGTTTFHALTKTTSSRRLCKIFKTLGYNKLTLQTGRIDFDIEDSEVDDFTVEHFDYKNSIAEDIQGASLVISHAGAGSVLDVLGAGKPLLVVINEELQGNHQIELAHQLAMDGHLYYCTCSSLCEKLQSCDFSTLKPLPPGKPENFATFLDSALGFS